MNTKFIGIKDFRQNIAEYIKQAQKNDVRYVVMKHNKPLCEVRPFAEGQYLDSAVQSVLDAEKEIAAGNVHSEEEILAEFAQ